MKTENHLHFAHNRGEIPSHLYWEYILITKGVSPWTRFLISHLLPAGHFQKSPRERGSFETPWSKLVSPPGVSRGGSALQSLPLKGSTAINRTSGQAVEEDLNIQFFVRAVSVTSFLPGRARTFQILSHLSMASQAPFRQHKRLRRETIQKKISETSLAVQWLRLCTSNVWSLVGELGSHMPSGAAEEKIKTMQSPLKKKKRQTRLLWSMQLSIVVLVISLSNWMMLLAWSLASQSGFFLNLLFLFRVFGYYPVRLTFSLVDIHLSLKPCLPKVWECM